ncbi:ABC transporter ATP-binding protein [Candidatus Omnitrophota bacterium]
MPELRLENISKDYAKTKALQNLNLSIKDGTFCVILGPSGSGKSTLLDIIAGLEEPTKGKIYLGSQDITGKPPHKRNMAMVFQTYALYPHLSAFENIAFGLRIKGERQLQIEKKVTGVAKILNIYDKLHKLPRQLSGGERQRVATGRAIVRDPALFLFDEPLSNLDARLRIELRAEFIKLHQRLRKTIIYVTHDQVEAMCLGEQVVVLNRGSIQQTSTPHDLFHNPRNLFVAEFIGTPPMNIIHHALPFQPALQKPLDKDIILGFRASAAKLEPQGQIRGEVVFTETIGEDSFAHIRINPEIEITAKVSDTPLPKPRDSVSITLNPEKVYYFTPDGKRC